MEYVYGALLLHSAGKGIDEAGLTKVLEAAGVKVETARVKAVITSLDGVNIEEAVKTAVAAPAAAAPAAAGAAPAEEKKKEEKEEEEEEEGATEEEAMAGLGALFG
ncbi:MAG: 50S ribosomal protein P1 [Candidatus Thermoplasmatota archaeon]|nr:50S ribosomal protein P1 [Candidatus Thermoplasmatota archaeon]